MEGNCTQIRMVQLYRTSSNLIMLVNYLGLNLYVVCRQPTISGMCIGGVESIPNGQAATQHSSTGRRAKWVGRVERR